MVKLLIVEPYEPLAAAVIFALEYPTTYNPHPLITLFALLSIVTLAELIVGLTELGATTVSFRVLVPTAVLPLYVVHVRVPVPLVALGI